MPRLLPTPSGSVVGGSAANCVSLALELRRQGADIELLASVTEEGLAYLTGSPLSKICTPLPTSGGGLLGKGLGTVRALRRGLRARLRETRFDVVHSHSGTYPYAVVPLAADRKTSVRLHSLYCPLGAKGGVYSKWWETASVARLAFERLDRVVAATQNVQRSIESTGLRPEKVELVPMCVNTERFRSQPRPEQTRYFPKDGAQTRILFVGNASREKGLAELLHAVKILREKKTRVSLVAAIENQSAIGEYEAGYARVQDFVRRGGLADCVRFAGLVETIEDLYAEADLLVIPWNTSRGPSDYPMVVLEAMAMGKCVISTPVGGCPELLAGGRAGILTQDFSAESIASAIQQATEDVALRKQLETAAVERARDFSVGASAARLLLLYENLLQRKAARHACCTV
jgi:glycosyltransferase involved in cell wall biosynthesis